jgi:hypothetical protein
MKTKIFTIALFFVGLSINAQQYTYYMTDYRNGNPSVMLGYPGDQFKSAITFSNTTGGNLYLHVKRTQKSIPPYWSQWYFYVQAKSPAQDTITLKIPAYSASILNLHFKTDSVTPGVATTYFKMYRLGYEDEAETFKLTASTNLAAEQGIRQELPLRDIRIFPNPTNGLLSITDIHKIITSITIYDGLGTEKFSSERLTTLHSADISDYPAGLYFIKVASGNSFYLEKIIKH